MSVLRRMVPFMFLPVLVACVSDGAAYVIDGPNHALSVVRENNTFWEKGASFAVVVSRMPDCQRRHEMGRMPDSAKVELWQHSPGVYIFVTPKKAFVTETRTCQGFAEMTEEPEGGPGVFLGTFAERGGRFAFISASKAEAGGGSE